MKSDLRLEFLHRMPLAPAGLALSTGTQDAVMTSAIMTILELIGKDADEVEAPEKGLADKSSRVAAPWIRRTLSSDRPTATDGESSAAAVRNSQQIGSSNRHPAWMAPCCTLHQFTRRQDVSVAWLLGHQLEEL